MSNLNYVPSWLDSAMTLLEKLNKCIEKIETIVNTVVSVTKTANDALNLANTNEADITELQNKTTTLETNVGAAKKEAHDAYSLANLANTTANTAQTIANGKSAKLYLHEIILDTMTYKFKFFSITEESKKYTDKTNSGEVFNVTLKPFNCVLQSDNGERVSKCLTLELSDILLSNGAQNCHGTINFAAYLDGTNQIVTITNFPEWNAAAFDGEIVTEL